MKADAIIFDMEDAYMFYRRKFYVVTNDFVEEFNNHFNKTNLPNQLSHGSRLIGRWMTPNDDDTTEIFAIWEYDNYEAYVEIENKIIELNKEYNKFYNEINFIIGDKNGKIYLLKDL